MYLTAPYPSPAIIGKNCETTSPNIGEARKRQNFSHIYSCLFLKVIAKESSADRRQSPGVLKLTASQFVQNISLKNCLRQCFLIQLQYGEEGFLRHFHVTDLFHSFFTSFLFFKRFTFTAHVATITLRGHILTNRLNGFTRNNLRSDSCPRMAISNC